MYRKEITIEVNEQWTMNELQSFIDSLSYFYNIFLLAKYGKPSRREKLFEIFGTDTITPANIHILLEKDELVNIDIEDASIGIIRIEGLADIVDELHTTLKKGFYSS